MLAYQRCTNEVEIIRDAANSKLKNESFPPLKKSRNCFKGDKPTMNGLIQSAFWT